MAWRSAEPDDPAALDAMLADVLILINTADPFTHTSPPLTRARTRTRNHYLDLSNEATISMMPVPWAALPDRPE